MRKKLNENGADIDARVEVVPFTARSGATHQMVQVTVVVAQKVYTYDVYVDERHPNIEMTCQSLKHAFEVAKETHAKVEVTEDRARAYLYVEFQGEPQRHYSGRRTD